MTKLDMKRKRVIVIILSFLLVGSVGSTTSIICFQELSERKVEPLQGSDSDLLHSMNEPQSSTKQDDLTLKIQTSGSITEDSDDFLAGRMENVTLNEAGSMVLEREGDDYNWANMTSLGPSARSASTMVYDSHSHKVILFGGYSGGSPPIYNAETWAYDLAISTWTNLNPSTSPSARRWHAMVYDSYSRKVILFGGEDISYDPQRDTWVYDLPTNTWTQLSPQTSPSERLGHVMVYDSYSRKVILFGGYDGTYFADTWTYDLLTNNWTQMNPLTSPMERAFHAMVYDSYSRKVLLFGGDNNNGNQADTWVYDLLTNTWTQMNPQTSPGEKAWHDMVYDSMHDKVILFGGRYGGAETWVYDLPSNNWTLLDPITSPSGRMQLTMVYDPNSAKVILYGGGINWGDHNADTWILYPKYSPTGMFDSQKTSFGNIYNLMGSITWNPSVQPVNTSLSFQVGLSNTTHDADFQYSAYSPSSFTFKGFAQFIRYRVVFEPDKTQFYSPLLDMVSISYSLENPVPLIQITDPQHSGIVEGLITISVFADSPNGIEKVCFYVGGQLIAFDYSAPYNCSWNSANSENGPVSVIVVAVSVLGKESADAIQLQVDNPVDSVPEVSVPSAPQSLSATTGDNFVELSWTAPNDDGGSTITSYRVYRGTTTGEYLFVGITTTTSFNDTLILGETTYYYVVTAINVIGESTFSTEVSATPTGVTIPKSGTFPSVLILLLFLGTLVLVTRKSRKT